MADALIAARQAARRMALRGVLALLLYHCTEADASRTFSSWISVGEGGNGGKDVTEALNWVKTNKDRVSSLSITGYGAPGAQNVSGPAFNAACRSLGVDTYMLWGGDWSSFATQDAIDATVNRTLVNVREGGYTGVDLDFEHPQTWGPQFVNMNQTFRAALRSKYSDLLIALSDALHAQGLKMSECVGTYPTAEGGVDIFYDPAVIAQTNDVVRVMNYDMYYVGGRSGNFPGRPDCSGMGPTSTAPWAEFSMKWWLARVPAQKLVMGLPAYSNDYSARPGFGGGNGTQQGVGPPGRPGVNDGSAGATNIEAVWDFWSQIYVYLYDDAEGKPRMRYGTEARSTRAHLRTAASLGIRAVGFWTANSADEEMVSAVWEWCRNGSLAS